MGHVNLMRNMRASTYRSAGLAVLALICLAVLGGCEAPITSGSKSVHYEHYFLVGQPGYAVPADIDERIASELAQRLPGLHMYCGLTDNFPERKNTTQLHNAVLLPLYEGRSFEPNYLPDPNEGWFNNEPYPGLLMDPHSNTLVQPGTLTIEEEFAILEFRLAPVQDGISELHIAGSFARQPAQMAIDEVSRIPVRREEYTKTGVIPAVGLDVTGSLRFPVSWTISGSLDGAAFSIELAQDYVVRRRRFSQRTGPG